MGLDVASFIGGITNTASFTPGANTPSPYNTSHTGVTDGTDPTSASVNVAEMYNRILLAMAALIDTAGVVVDHANWTQLTTGVQALISQAITAGSFVTNTQYSNDFVNSLINNGYADLKGGLIIHWGRFTCPGGGSDLAITFSPAFPHACLGAVCSSGDSSRVLSISSTAAPTATTLTVNNGGNTGFYIAIGW